MEPIISASFLITAEDYRSYCCESARLSAAKQSRVFFRIFGIVLLAVGVGGAVFLSHDVTNYLIWGFCLIAGLFFSLYYAVLEPFFVIRRADCEYRRIYTKFSAQTVEFYPDEVRVSSARCTGRYPYEILYRAVQTDRFFLIFIGMGELRVLPLRLLDPEQVHVVHALLNARLGDRFIVRTGK